MTEYGFYQIITFLIVVFLLIKPMGWYMSQVYQGKSCGLNRLLQPLERFIYRFCGIESQQEMDWRAYLFAVLIFNCIGLLFSYLILRLQGVFTLNPQHFDALPPGLAFNIATSFTTNSDWQSYAGESTLSYLSQMLVCTVQNFLSAATGMSVGIAFIRGLVKQESQGLGNFWVDLVRSILYILLPISIGFAFFLCAQGVIQNLATYQSTIPLQPMESTRMLPMGPVASQVAIKLLGTNGGGFFNVNAAHPFENPTPLTHFFGLVLMILIPSAFCYTFGIMVKNLRQGYLLLITMFIIYVPSLLGTIFIEQSGNPLIKQMNSSLSSTANMEGKEVRNGVVGSAIWAVTSTATSNGAMSADLDAYIPLGGMVPLWLMSLHEIIFGGVGTGLYGNLLTVMLTVFICGLIVGRTPAYLGKRIEPFEMKMVCVSILIMPCLVLFFTALTCLILPPSYPAGPHTFTQILYTYTSLANNNGSAMAGLNTHTFYYWVSGGLVMLMGRFWVMISVLALAGSLVKKKQLPPAVSHLSTDTVLFLVILVSVILLLGALSFFPAFILGPIVEQFKLWSMHG